MVLVLRNVNPFQNRNAADNSQSWRFDDTPDSLQIEKVRLWGSNNLFLSGSSRLAHSDLETWVELCHAALMSIVNSWWSALSFHGGIHVQYVLGGWSAGEDVKLGMHTVTRILKTRLLGLIDVFSFRGDFASSSVLPQEHYVAHELLH